MKVNWGLLGITVGLILLAGSIFFAAIKISAKIDTTTQLMEKELVTFQREIKTDTVAILYGYRQSCYEKRPLTLDDLKEGKKLASGF